MSELGTWQVRLDIADVGRLLDDRQRQALLGFALGYSHAEIARAVHLSPATVKRVLTIAKETLGARTLTEAASAVLLFEVRQR